MGRGSSFCSWPGIFWRKLKPMGGFSERNLSRHEQKSLKICWLIKDSLPEAQSGKVYFPLLLLIRKSFISGPDVTGTIIACALEMVALDIRNEDPGHSRIFLSFSLWIKEKKKIIKEITRITAPVFLLFSAILLQKY